MNRVDKSIDEAQIAIDETLELITTWSFEEWRGQLANAKEIAHQLDEEAEVSGRCD